MGCELIPMTPRPSPSMAEFVSGLHAREPLGFGHSSELAATVSDARADERGEEPDGSVQRHVPDPSR